MFKSPIRNMPVPKRSPINFVKTVASPRYPNSSKAITISQLEFPIDHFSKQSGSSFLSLEITQQKTNHPHRCIFPYNNQTSISELIEFIRKEVTQMHIYCGTRDLNVDYLLTLGHRKVKELKTKRIEIEVCRIKADGGKRWLRMFEIIKCVGTGGFSRVYLCRAYGQLFALKVINKEFIVENEKLNIIQNERLILQLCNSHPFITKLHMSFQTKNYLFFCMEYCNGGELFNLLRKVRRMNEDDAKFYFLETLSAISHLHSQKILYRDLKPENIIIDSDGHIRLADYGLSKIMKEDLTHSFCGSAEYMAPEMLLKKGHSFQIDYYCLGALLYELLLGLPPYYSRNQNELFSNILNKQLEFPPNAELSKDLKKFLHRMLEKDTDLRFKNIKEILDHPWLKNVNMDDVLKKKLVPPFKTDMYLNNFDESEFAKDEQKERFKIERQKDEPTLSQSQIVFPFFSYKSAQIKLIQAEMHKNAEQKKPDFSKKPPTLTFLDSSQKEMIRPHNMKSVDSSKLNYQKGYYFQQSPRITQNQTQSITHNSRSGEKFKMFISQTPSISSFGSQIIPEPSSLLGKMKGSEIINNSILSSELNNSGSKLIGVRSVPLIQKVSAHSPGHQRMGSPININNYINIYTNKMPSKGPQINFTSSALNVVSAQKKMSHGNTTFQKSLVSSSNSYKSNYSYGSFNGSIQRTKFNSLDKPSMIYSSSSNFLKNSPYYQSSANVNRGYLSNFKERLNPNHKMKKSYKTNEKFSFNVLNSSNGVKH